MDFEWNESKRAANKRKREVDFNTLAVALADPHGVESIEYVAGEERWRLIAMTAVGLLCVIHIEREDVTRIISARRATNHEARTYHSRKLGDVPVFVEIGQTGAA